MGGWRARPAGLWQRMDAEAAWRRSSQRGGTRGCIQYSLCWRASSGSKEGGGSPWVHVKIKVQSYRCQSPLWMCDSVVWLKIYRWHVISLLLFCPFWIYLFMYLFVFTGVKYWSLPPCRVLMYPGNSSICRPYTKLSKTNNNKNTFQSGVIISSAEFNLLLGYFVTDQQYHSIYNYKYSILYSSYSNTLFSLAYLQNTFFFMYMFSCQCNVTFFQRHVTKKVL